MRQADDFSAGRIDNLNRNAGRFPGTVKVQWPDIGRGECSHGFVTPGRQVAVLRNFGPVLEECLDDDVS